MSGIMFQIPAAPVVWPIAAMEVSCVLTVLIRRRRLTLARLATVVVVGLYTAALLSATLFPLQVETGDYGNRVSWIDKVNVIPLWTIDAPTFVLNLLLTAPLGFLLPLLRRGASWGTAALVGLGVSLVVEILQFVTDVLVSSGRTADVNDLIANTCGALIGFAAAALASRAHNGPELRARLALWSRADSVARVA